ncbi:hypothetical protein ACTXT7_012006 [Hymenolepis weldensis]
MAKVDVCKVREHSYKWQLTLNIHPDKCFSFFKIRVHSGYIVEFTTLTRLIESRALEQAEVQFVTGRVENKRGRECRDLLNQSAIKIPAA